MDIDGQGRINLSRKATLQKKIRKIVKIRNKMHEPRFMFLL